MKYSLSEISKIYGIPVSTLRYYIKNNMSPDFEVGEKRQLYVDGGDVTDFSIIYMLKAAGCPMKTISEVLNEFALIKQPNTDMKNAFRCCKNTMNEHVDALTNQMKELTEQLQVANYVRWLFEQFENKGTNILENDDYKYSGHLPKNFEDKMNELDFTLSDEQLLKDWVDKYPHASLKTQE